MNAPRDELLQLESSTNSYISAAQLVMGAFSYAGALESIRSSNSSISSSSWISCFIKYWICPSGGGGGVCLISFWGIVPARYLLFPAKATRLLSWKITSASLRVDSCVCFLKVDVDSCPGMTCVSRDYVCVFPPPPPKSIYAIGKPAFQSVISKCWI